QIRQAFLPGDSDQVLVAADYSQIELRLLAHFSQDPALTRAFAEDVDIHTAVAAQIAGVPLDAVTSEQRRLAKTVNFGVMYGVSARSRRSSDAGVRSPATATLTVRPAISRSGRRSTPSSRAPRPTLSKWRCSRSTIGSRRKNSTQGCCFRSTTNSSLRFARIR